MSISDAELARIRASRWYRPGIWVARVSLVCFAAWVATLFNDWPVISSDVVEAVFLVSFGLGWGVSLVLWHRAGVTYVRRGLGWEVEERRVLWQVWRDIFWFGPRRVPPRPRLRQGHRPGKGRR